MKQYIMQPPLYLFVKRAEYELFAGIRYRKFVGEGGFVGCSFRDVCRKSFYPKTEQIIEAPQPGFAEQDPANWYTCAKSAIKDAMYEAGAAQKMLKR